ncbi:MAG: four helix bundle protein [Ignavibacteriae bacterium]|nr:four helix bundle protein [Ignavibacteriota bacterium]
MTSDELKQRTKTFALRVIRLVENLLNNMIGKVLGNQLIRSATSVGANYRAACRSRSKQEFVSRIKVVEEEADESLFWLELIMEKNIFKLEKINGLIKEADELTAIFTSTNKTAKVNFLNQRSKIKNQKSC